MDKRQPFRCQLERLFVYYSSFGDKENPTLLKIQNYRRLLTDMQLLVPPSATQPQVPLVSKCDVIFYAKASPTTALSFSAFLDLLDPLSCLFFSESAFDNLIKFHIQPLHDYIMNQTDFGESVALITPHLLREVSYNFLRKFEDTITTIYKHYFTLSGKEGESDELKAFMKLSRELGFMPRVISKPIAYLTFIFLRNRDSVVAFKASSTFKSKFRFDVTCLIDYIIILSHLNRRGPETDQTKIYYLLQSMQVSQGYKQISKIVKLQHFFVPHDELQEPTKLKRQSYQQEIFLKKPIQVVETPLRKKLGEYYEGLKAKFVRLCTKKHVQSNFYLKQSVAIKMLAQICPKLPQNTCEQLLATVGRLSFQNFVTLINLTAERLKIDQEKLYDEVANYTEGSSCLTLVLENMHLEEEEQANCQEVLQIVRNYLRTLFDFYEFGGTISLTNFIKLLQETQVIPRVLEVVQGSDIFTSCDKGKGLNFQQFEQSFLRIIVSVHFKHELEGVQRLLHILQTICKSKRGETLMKKNLLMVKQHPLYKVRLIFGDVYRRLNVKLQS